MGDFHLPFLPGFPTKGVLAGRYHRGCCHIPGARLALGVPCPHPPLLPHLPFCQLSAEPLGLYL